MGIREEACCVPRHQACFGCEAYGEPTESDAAASGHGLLTAEVAGQICLLAFSVP
jgi:hypothetical protein